MNDRSMSFLDHLEELRWVFLRSLIALSIATGLCLYFSPDLYRILMAPLEKILPENSHFIITSPFEAYFAYFKISLVVGIFLTSPWAFYFLWSFIRPGLLPQERRGILPVALLCSLLFVGGASFGYFVVFPPGFSMAVDILQGTSILMMPRMSDYLSLALRLLIAFGIIFELPLFLFLLGRLGLVQAQGLRQVRKYVIVGIFLVAGILTPGPDVLSQVLMALPLMVLYEVGIILVRLFGKMPSPPPTST